MTDFDGSDPFGTFTSPAAPASVSTSKNPTSSLDNMAGTSSQAFISSKKETFQVKSGIWADSLSRGLIDLNISAHNKVNLAGVGVVGGLNDGWAAVPLPQLYSSKPMSSESGYTSSPSKGMYGDEFFSSPSSGEQYQFNYSKK